MTDIEWTHAPGFTGESWNPVVGCSLESPGCTNCYAMRKAFRLREISFGKSAGAHGLTHYRDVVKKTAKGDIVWTGLIKSARDELFMKPLRWKKPRMVFVNSMGDLFHESIPDRVIDRVFAVMALCPQHVFLILTKRAARMREYMTEQWQPAPAHRIEGFGRTIDVPAESKGETRETQVRAACEPIMDDRGLNDPDKDELWTADGRCKAMEWDWPLPNVWLGVSAEDQTRADARIPVLLATPAAGRFISAEPLLGPIDLSPFLQSAPARGPSLNWVITGGESGPGARPPHPDWFRSLRDQCAAAPDREGGQTKGTPFFFKQWGSWAPVPDPALCETARDRLRIVKSFEGCDISEESLMANVGKSSAGALLDGMQHFNFPDFHARAPASAAPADAASPSGRPQAVADNVGDTGRGPLPK